MPNWARLKKIEKVVRAGQPKSMVVLCHDPDHPDLIRDVHGKTYTQEELDSFDTVIRLVYTSGQMKDLE